MPYYYSPFRKDYKQNSSQAEALTEKACPFCNPDLTAKQALKHRDGTLFENEHCRWLVNWFPRTDAHTMIVPKRHITTIEDERPEEILARHQLLVEAVSALQNTFDETGFECFLQTGKDSLSSIKHLHWHLIPTASQTKDTLSLTKIGYRWTTSPETIQVKITPTQITLAREFLIETIAQGN